MNDIAIRVDHLSKAYQRGLQQPGAQRDVLSTAFRRWLTMESNTAEGSRRNMTDNAAAAQLPIADRADRIGNGQVYMTQVRWLDAQTYQPITTHQCLSSSTDKSAACSHCKRFVRTRGFVL